MQSESIIDYYCVPIANYQDTNYHIYKKSLKLVSFVFIGLIDPFSHNSSHINEEAESWKKKEKMFIWCDGSRNRLKNTESKFEIRWKTFLLVIYEFKIVI